MIASQSIKYPLNRIQSTQLWGIAGKQQSIVSHLKAVINSRCNVATTKQDSKGCETLHILKQTQYPRSVISNFGRNREPRLLSRKVQENEEQIKPSGQGAQIDSDVRVPLLPGALDPKHVLTRSNIVSKLCGDKHELPNPPLLSESSDLRINVLRQRRSDHQSPKTSIARLRQIHQRPSKSRFLLPTSPEEQDDEVTKRSADLLPFTNSVRHHSLASQPIDREMGMDLRDPVADFIERGRPDSLSQFCGSSMANSVPEHTIKDDDLSVLETSCLCQYDEDKPMNSTYPAVPLKHWMPITNVAYRYVKPAGNTTEITPGCWQFADDILISNLDIQKRLR